MAGKPNVALRVLAIVCLSGIIAGASLTFLAGASLGLLRPVPLPRTLKLEASLSEEASSRLSSGRYWWVTMVFVGGYGVILGGGFLGIFRLAKGIQARPAAGKEAVAPASRLTLREAAKLLGPLWLAMAAWAVTGWLQWRGQHPTLWFLPYFLFSQLPYGAVFWLTRAGPDRKGVGLALAFSAAALLQGLWLWGNLLALSAQLSRRLSVPLIFMADVVAAAAVMFFAYRLWRHGPGSRHDAAILLAGILGWMAYQFVLHFALPYLLFTLRLLGGGGRY